MSLTEIQEKIERLESITTVSKFYRENDISQLSEDDLLSLTNRILHLNASSRLDTYLDFIRDELADRRQRKLHQQNADLSRAAIIVSIVVAIATIVQAIVAIHGIRYP